MAFVFKKSLYKVSNTVSKVAIFSIGGNSEDGMYFILGVQLYFRRFPIDGFSGKWWSK